jgi:hypothetical protein
MEDMRPYAPIEIDEPGCQRPVIPVGVEVPQGNSRKAILARYKLARGIPL